MRDAQCEGVAVGVHVWRRETCRITKSFDVSYIVMERGDGWTDNYIH